MAKPSKPYPDYPLFAHDNGQWAKKHKGKVRYFGHWDNPDAALAKFQAFLDGREVGQSNDSAPESEPVTKRLDFPLSIHKASGRWYKKVRGRMYYFGKAADDPAGEKALRQWVEQKDDLVAGRKSRVRVSGGVTVDEVVNRFLGSKLEYVQSGEISQRTYDEYEDTAKLVQKQFGEERLVSDLGPDDFKTLRGRMAKKWGPVRLGNEIQRVRMIFKHAESYLGLAIQYGDEFRKPTAKVVRLSTAQKGPRDLNPEQVQAILEAATPNMKAMILLALNGGFGNTDLGLLPITAINLEKATLYWPRTKTGVPRTVPLWPETVKAIREVLASRKEPKDKAHAELLFISPQRKCYVRNERSYGLSAEFSKAVKLAGVEGYGFYDLRRTFETIAEGAHDLAAVQAIMGHTPHANDMSARYRQRVAMERLLAVTNYMRTWLYGEEAKAKSA